MAKHAFKNMFKNFLKICLAIFQHYEERVNDIYHIITETMNNNPVLLKNLKEL